MKIKITGNPFTKSREAGSAWNRAVNKIFPVVFDAGQELEYEQFRPMYEGVLMAAGHTAKYAKEHAVPYHIKKELDGKVVIVE